MKTNVPVTYKMASPSQVRRGHFDEAVWIENIFEALDEPGEWVLDYDQHLTIIERNIIKDCCGEGFITKGNNTIVNNIIINLMQYTPEGTRAFHDRGYLVLPWGEVDGSVIQRNIFVSYHANQTILTEGRRRGRPDPHLRDCQADYNIYFNTQNPDWAADYLRKHQAEGIEQHSVNAKPMFYNMRKGDFQLEANSPALFRGFLPFNLNNAGLLSD
jgi:hypothetical protein